jgi:hypothetical protein
MSAADGSTRWEHRYTARSRKRNMTQFGTGPHATPLVLDDRILDGPTWTVPTLVGTRLYIQDKKKILALELGHS